MTGGQIPDDGTLIFDGLDDAIVGSGQQGGQGPIVSVYSAAKIIEILKFRDGLSDEDAIDLFYYNIATAFFGKGTPLILIDN